MELSSYPNNTSVGVASYVPFVMPTSTNSLEPFYDSHRPLYVIGQYVKYDIQNGSLIIQNTNDPSSKSITVYERDGSYKIFSTQGQTHPPESLSNVTFKPFYAVDNIGQNIVLYLPFQTNTLVALIGFSDANKTTFKINNVCRFTSTTIDKGPNSSVQIKPNSSTPISEFYKMPSITSNTKQKYSEDYLLKTQIVPPVCPSCPVCNVGACTNCGGNGGSGTLSQNGNTVVSGKTVSSNNPNSNSTNPNNNSFGGVVNRGIGAVENVTKEVLYDATSLIKGAGSGIKDILTQGNRNNSYGTGNGTGLVNKSVNINRTEGEYKSPYGTQNIDQYSYYGALPSKGDSNYMPMTADFSKFGR